MSVSLDIQRTFQYFQALYSVVNFSLKLFHHDINDFLRHIDFFYNRARQFVCHCLFSCGNRIFLGNIRCHGNDCSCLAINLYRHFDLVIFHGFHVISRPSGCEHATLMFPAAPRFPLRYEGRMGKAALPLWTMSPYRSRLPSWQSQSIYCYAP